VFSVTRPSFLNGLVVQVLDYFQTRVQGIVTAQKKIPMFWVLALYLLLRCRPAVTVFIRLFP
jgi:hypothetical protein